MLAGRRHPAPAVVPLGSAALAIPAILADREYSTAGVVVVVGFGPAALEGVRRYRRRS
ncbi:MAG: hypothetical protein ACK5OX_17580 [Desertimonas sp.]